MTNGSKLFEPKKLLRLFLFDVNTLSLNNNKKILTYNTNYKNLRNGLNK